MAIKNFISCDNDDIIPRQSKMIANVLLSGNGYSIYNYSDISKIIEQVYNIKIPHNKQYSKDKMDVGEYAGILSELCYSLGLPLISVMIRNQKTDMPGSGFYTVCDKCNILVGSTKVERRALISEEVAKCFEDNSWQILIDYLGGEQNEEAEIKYSEGIEKEITILKKERNLEIVRNVKRRDKYTCQACGFYYHNKVVHAHHLKPLFIENGEHEVKEDDLITLCPTCHSLAHLLLNDDIKYENKELLLAKIKEITIN